MEKPASSGGGKERSTRASTKRVLFFIGWPGVGKTTVGRALSRRIGYPLFDNHLIYREVCRFLPRGSRRAHALNSRLQRMVLQTMLRSAVPGIICTLSIRRRPTGRAVYRAVQMAEKMRAKVDFVELVCDWKEHRQRVTSATRREATKTNTVGKLQLKMKQPRFNGLRSHPALVINNTRLSPRACADQIIDRLNLVG